MKAHNAPSSLLKYLFIDRHNLDLKEVCMQQDNQFQDMSKRLRPNRLIKNPQHFITTGKWQQMSIRQGSDVAAQPTQHLEGLDNPPKTPFANLPPLSDEDFDDEGFDISVLSTHHLMQLSGMMRAVNIKKEQQTRANKNMDEVVEWWPDGIKQTGPVPVVNLYGREPLGRSMPPPALRAALPVMQVPAKPQPVWRAFLAKPAVRVMLGLLFGIGVLFLVSRVIDVPNTINILRTNLSTPLGITHALLASFFFIAAFSIRGTRWKLFLSRITSISTLKAIQIFWVAVFINFLLPVQGGEVAKTLMLKRVANVPISQSLPTVAMDKALDLMPALFILAIVPFIPGIHMTPILWIVLSLVGSILIAVILTISLAAWKRKAAIGFIHFFLRLLPKGIASKIDGFAMGFVDSLLAGASNPKTFIPAVLLTCLAVTCDGLFAWMAFLTVGLSQMNFGTAIFGYTFYNMFSILPTAPGQIGSNEGVGEIVFHGLLGFNQNFVGAMFVFSHPLAALIMTTMCLIALRGLKITLSSALKIESNPPLQQPVVQPLPQSYAQEREAVQA